MSKCTKSKDYIYKEDNSVDMQVTDLFFLVNLFSEFDYIITKVSICDLSCKMKYIDVSMRLIFVNMRLMYVDMRLIYDIILVNYVNMRGNYAKMRLIYINMQD